MNDGSVISGESRACIDNEEDPFAMLR